MKYVYIGNEYNGKESQDSFAPKADYHIKKWLEAIIFTEQPYLAEHLVVEGSDEEMMTLLKFCKFFSAILRDENPEPINDWSLRFEGRHHSLIGMYLNFIYNVYNKE